MIASRLKTACLALTLVIAPLGAVAQDRAQSLADIRQELTMLHVEIQKLRVELSTTGTATMSTLAGSPTQRLDVIESEMSRLTSKIEQLEFRVNSIVKDGTNRIGDLEFRLVELEGGDLSQLGETTTLGGGEMPATAATAPLVPDTPTTELAIGEQQDFDTAGAALEAGEFQQAAALYTSFVDNYPGSPLAAEAHFQRGEALNGAGDIKNAARAYLNSFSGAPNGDRAPDALFRLGQALGGLGQVTEACATLTEVDKRFPGAPAATDAIAARAELECQ